MYKIIYLYLFFILSTNVLSNELGKSFNLLIKDCNEKKYSSNLKKLEKAFYKAKKHYSDNQLIDINIKNSNSLIWNIMRVYYPYEIPKDSPQSGVYTKCSVLLEKFHKTYLKKDWQKWNTCIGISYNGKIPLFERSVIKCTQKIIQKK